MLGSRRGGLGLGMRNMQYVELFDLSTCLLSGNCRFVKAQPPGSGRLAGRPCVAIARIPTGSPRSRMLNMNMTSLSYSRQRHEKESRTRCRSTTTAVGITTSHRPPLLNPTHSRLSRTLPTRPTQAARPWTRHPGQRGISDYKHSLVLPYDSLLLF